MLNISKQIYTGWDTNSATTLSEAQVIPYGDSVNERKKHNTLSTKYNIINEYDNIPLPGFTLFDSNKKYYGSADSTWLIIDPRGFIVRITQQNLSDILKVTGITEGLIQQKCVWARENSQTTMILVPISSPKYIEATINTDLIESKVSMTDVQIGDTVLLQNKLQGRYMGTLSLYGPTDWMNRRTTIKPQAALRRQVLEVSPGKYHYQTNIKILKVLNKATTTLTREESTKTLNDSITAGNSYFTPGTMMNGRYFSVHGLITYVSIHAVSTVKIKLEEITIQTATELFDTCRAVTDCGVIVLENQAGKKYIIDFPWYASTTYSATVSSFNTKEIKSINDDKIELVEDKNHQTTYYTHEAPVSLDNFTKFYKIVKYVKHDTYI